MLFGSEGFLDIREPVEHVPCHPQLPLAWIKRNWCIMQWLAMPHQGLVVRAHPRMAAMKVRRNLIIIKYGNFHRLFASRTALQMIIQ